MIADCGSGRLGSDSGCETEGGGGVWIKHFNLDWSAGLGLVRQVKSLDIE